MTALNQAKRLVSGTNLQALIDFTRDPVNFSAAEIVLVVSNKPDVQGLVRAENAGIATKVNGCVVIFFVLWNHSV